MNDFACFLAQCDIAEQNAAQQQLQRAGGLEKN